MKKSNDNYGWMQDLKDLAEAEKNLEITPYVSIHFELKRKNTYDGQVLHTLDMPRSMLDRWRWLIRWREARFQCVYSRDDVRCSYCFFVSIYIWLDSYYASNVSIFNGFDEIVK